jgi:hypothetical protein
MRGAWCRASVNASVPCANSKSASVIRAGSFASLASQQTPGDHQVQHEKPFVLESEYEAFAELPHVGDAVARDLRYRWQRSVQHERIENPRVRGAASARAWRAPR